MGTVSCSGAETCSKAVGERKGAHVSWGRCEFLLDMNESLLEVLHWIPRGRASDFDLRDQSFTEKHKILT